LCSFAQEPFWHASGGRLNEYQLSPADGFQTPLM
jgi:hypothetical protein